MLGHQMPSLVFCAEVRAVSTSRPIASRHFCSSRPLTLDRETRAFSYPA